jgi:hypothetical protein
MESDCQIEATLFDRAAFRLPDGEPAAPSKLSSKAGDMNYGLVASI